MREKTKRRLMEFRFFFAAAPVLFAEALGPALSRSRVCSGERFKGLPAFLASLRARPGATVSWKAAPPIRRAQLPLDCVGMFGISNRRRVVPPVCVCVCTTRLFINLQVLLTLSSQLRRTTKAAAMKKQFREDMELAIGTFRLPKPPFPSGSYTQT